jgi:hypothetical protein
MREPYNKYHFIQWNLPTSLSKSNLVVLQLCRNFSAAFRKIAKRDYKICHVCITVCLFSLPPARKELYYHWTDFHEIWYWVFFENMTRNFEFHWNLAQRTGTLHEVQYTFMISRWILLRMRNVSDNRSNNKRNFMSITFFRNFGLLRGWKNMVVQDKSQTTI